MIRNKKVQLVFVLVLLLGAIGFAQDTPMSTDEGMKEKILAIYKSGGETGLRDFLKVNIDAVDNYLIRTFSERGVTEKNEDLLKIALIIAEEMKNEQFIALVHMFMGKYFSSIGNFEKMVEYFEKAFPVLEKINDPKITEDTKMLKKMIWAFKNDVNEFIKIGEELLSLYERDGDLCMMAGNLYAMRGDSINAFTWFDKALVFFEDKGNLEGQGKIYTFKGVFYALFDDKVKSLEMFDKALSCFEKTGNLEETCHVYILKGDIYRYTGEDIKALKMYDNAFLLYEKRGDRSGMAQINLIIGDIYLKYGEEANSIKMFDQALALFEKEKNYGGVRDVYYEKGAVYSRKGDSVNALKMIEKAMSFSDKFGFHFDRGSIYGAMGSIYAVEGDYSKALEMFEKTLIIFKKSGNILSL